MLDFHSIEIRVSQSSWDSCFIFFFVLWRERRHASARLWLFPGSTTYQFRHHAHVPNIYYIYVIMFLPYLRIVLWFHVTVKFDTGMSGCNNVFYRLVRLQTYISFVYQECVLSKCLLYHRNPLNLWELYLLDHELLSFKFQVQPSSH